MALLPIPSRQRKALAEKLAKDGTRRIDPVMTPLAIEKAYRTSLFNIIRQLKSDITKQVIPLLVKYEKDYVGDADSYQDLLSDIFEKLRKKYSELDSDYEKLAGSFVARSDATNKRKFVQSVEKAIGIDLGKAVAGDRVENALKAAVTQNVSLIRSIPDEYFKQIETIVYQGTISGSNVKSLTEEITRIGGVTESRAKLIARDQTAKLNSNLTRERAKDIGSEEYIWRTAGDDRVRQSHATKNGRTYKWSEPPKDTGNPGEDIQCRCIAEPLFSIV